MVKKLPKHNDCREIPFSFVNQMKQKRILTHVHPHPFWTFDRLLPIPHHKKAVFNSHTIINRLNEKKKKTHFSLHHSCGFLSSTKVKDSCSKKKNNNNFNREKWRIKKKKIVTSCFHSFRCLPISCLSTAKRDAREKKNKKLKDKSTRQKQQENHLSEIYYIYNTCFLLFLMLYET